MRNTEFERIFSEYFEKTFERKYNELRYKEKKWGADMLKTKYPDQYKQFVDDTFALYVECVSAVYAGLVYYESPDGYLDMFRHLKHEILHDPECHIQALFGRRLTDADFDPFQFIVIGDMSWLVKIVAEKYLPYFTAHTRYDGDVIFNDVIQAVFNGTYWIDKEGMTVYGSIPELNPAAKPAA